MRLRFGDRRRRGTRIALSAMAATLTVAATMAARAQAPFTTAAFATGTFTQESGGGPGCPPGADCSNFRVTCPSLDAAITGDLAVRPASSPRGLVMFFQAAGGGTFVPQGTPAQAFLDDLHDAGFVIVEVRWDSRWAGSATGEKAGPAKLGCRPATVVKWVEAHLYDEKSHGAGECGFCLVGVSAGASAISYVVSHYGLDGIVDALIPFGGPPHAAMVKGCLPGYGAGYTYPDHIARGMDEAYGFYGGDGPCEKRDPSYTDEWKAGSVDTGAFDLVHPATRFVFMFGTDDGTVGPPHGQDYADKLEAAGSKMVYVKTLSGVPHEPWQSSSGLAAVEAALLAETGPGTPGTGGGGGGGGGGSGSGGSGSGGSGSGGKGTASPSPSPSPSVTPSPTSPSPTATATGGSPEAAAPLAPSGGFPWSILLLLAAPVIAVSAYLMLRRAKLPIRGD